MSGPTARRAALCWWAPWVAILAFGGCGDLYSSQPLPLREYATLELNPGCIKADGQPWLVDGVLGLGRIGFVQRVLWDDTDLDIQVYHESCDDLRVGGAAEGAPPTGEGLEVCFVVVVAPEATEGVRDLTVYVEAGDGLIVARSELGVYANCGAE